VSDVQPCVTVRGGYFDERSNVAMWSEGETIVKRFGNRTVIVTGGALGMGASHARDFVAEGANVVIADVLEQEGQIFADELGDHAIFSRLGITSVAVGMHEDPFAPHTRRRKRWFRLADHIGAWP
jgi:hypothetical protein